MRIQQNKQVIPKCFYWKHHGSTFPRTLCLIALLDDPSKPDVIKLFSCLTQPSLKFIMLINAKMPTIVGILTFISMVNTTSESLKARKGFIFYVFRFYEQLKFHAQLS